MDDTKPWPAMPYNQENSAFVADFMSGLISINKKIDIHERIHKMSDVEVYEPILDIYLEDVPLDKRIKAVSLIFQKIIETKRILSFMEFETLDNKHLLRLWAEQFVDTFLVYESMMRVPLSKKDFMWLYQNNTGWEPYIPFDKDMHYLQIPFVSVSLISFFVRPYEEEAA